MYQVWEKYMQYAAQNEKVAGRGSEVPGVPLFVVPGASASNFAFVNNNHKNVFTTINAAYAAAVAGQGDTIVLTPGAHTLSANLAWSTAGVRLIGPEAYEGRRVRKSAAIVTAAAGAKGITITAADAQLIGVTFVPVTTKSMIDFSALALRLRVDSCFFDLATPAASTSTKGMVATGAAPDAHISNCTFLSGGAQGPAIDVTGMLDFLIELNRFEVNAGTWANSILVGAAARGTISANYFGGAGTTTAAIDGTGATGTGGLAIQNNGFGVRCTVPIDNFSAVGLTDLLNNYLATVGGGSGGTLITANT